MKQGTIFTRIAMLVLFLGLACYLGLAAWNSLTDPFTTTLAYEYTADDSVEAAGILVREEQVLSAPSGIVDLQFDEGEKVGVGQAVAYLYQTEEAAQRRYTIRTLEQEVEQLEYAAAQGDSAGDAKLDQTIISQAVDLRASAARQSFTQLEDQVLELKSTVLKRDYTYGDGSGLAALQEQLTQLRSQLRTLRSQAGADTRAVTASVSGTFSALVDGYETLITPSDLSDLTPAALRALLDQQVSEDSAAVGKLITANRWYFAALLSESDAQRLTVGKQTVVRFSRDFDADVSMRVESVSQGADGQAAVVFSSTRYLSQTTLLRKQTAEVIFDSSSGIRVPKKALHVTEETVTDEDGTQRVTQVYGVYAVVGSRAELKPVEIVGESGDFYVVTSVDSDKTALRAGNEIIVAAQGLYDGKVVR
jgi:hypothetical protein